MSVLFVVFVLGFALLGLANHGGGGLIFGAFVGLCLWLVAAVAWFLWSAMSVDHCEEYGYPDLHDLSEGKSCPVE